MFVQCALTAQTIDGNSNSFSQHTAFAVATPHSYSLFIPQLNSILLLISHFVGFIHFKQKTKYIDLLNKISRNWRGKIILSVL